MGCPLALYLGRQSHKPDPTILAQIVFSVMHRGRVMQVTFQRVCVWNALMSPPLDSYASPHGEPTPLQNPLHSQLMKHLRALKDKQARHLSHLQFIRASLRNNITPGGLKINISQQADEADKNLRKKWKKIIQRTQIQLLKLLILNAGFHVSLFVFSLLHINRSFLELDAI